MIQIAIVEDEDTYANQLTKYIERYQKESKTRIHITRFRDGDEIVEKYTGEFDIILMDIQMRFMDGMTAAEEIRKMDSQVIIMFITNMTNYAIQGYQVDAMDYVLKPITYFAFSKKLERAIRRLAKKEEHIVTITTTDCVIRLPMSDIYYVESEGHNLVWKTKKGDFRMRERMQDAENKLGEYGFFRSNKGYLVNLEYVDSVKDGCCIVGGEKLLISRARKADFMKALTQYIGEN